MKINIAKASYDGRWFEFGEARLKVRPYPNSRRDITIKSGAVILSGDAGLDMFSYCLTEWDGVIGADETPLELTPEVKKKIYDFRLGCIGEESMSDFVLRTARELTEEIGTDTKN